jgi:hypothetical protein
MPAILPRFPAPIGSVSPVRVDGLHSITQVDVKMDQLGTYGDLDGVGPGSGRALAAHRFGIRSSRHEC